MLRSRGSYTVIDKITVSLNIKRDVYEAEFSNLGLKAVPISDEYPEKYDRLLCGGIWCIVQLDYEYIEEDKKNGNPIQIRKLTPIQLSLTVCTAIFPVGRFQSFVRSISRMTTDSLRTTSPNISGSCGRNSTAMRWLTTSTLEKI